MKVSIIPRTWFGSPRDHPLQYYMDVWKAISRAGGVGDSVKRSLDLRMMRWERGGFPLQEGTGQDRT